MAEGATSERTGAVAALLTEFCWRADNGLGNQIAELFTDAATIDTPDFNLAGKAEIDAWFTGRAGTKLSRHCWTNLRITPLGVDRYRAETNMMTTVGAVPAPQRRGKIVVANSVDEIVFQNGIALFAARKLQVAFEGSIVAGEVES